MYKISGGIAGTGQIHWDLWGEDRFDRENGLCVSFHFVSLATGKREVISTMQNVVRENNIEWLIVAGESFKIQLNRLREYFSSATQGFGWMEGEILIEPEISVEDIGRFRAKATVIRFVITEEMALMNSDSTLDCGPQAKAKCDRQDEVKGEYSVSNLFLDIPYSNYNDCEKALRDMLSELKLNPVAAKDKVTSSDILCKVCRMIKKCKYGITDISSCSNSVSYEYGLMHGLGMKVCLVKRSTEDRFSDIDGLEYASYSGVNNLVICIAKWLRDNVKEIDQVKVKALIERKELELLSSGADIPLVDISPPSVIISDINLKFVNNEQKYNHRFFCCAVDIINKSEKSNSIKDIILHVGEDKLSPTIPPHTLVKAQRVHLVDPVSMKPMECIKGWIYFYGQKTIVKDGIECYIQLITVGGKEIRAKLDLAFTSEF